MYVCMSLSTYRAYINNIYVSSYISAHKLLCAQDGGARGLCVGSIETEKSPRLGASLYLDAPGA